MDAMRYLSKEVTMLRKTQRGRRAPASGKFFCMSKISQVKICELCQIVEC